MLIELILLLAAGALFCFFGLRIWKFNKIKLIHDYHYKNVPQEHQKAYTAQMGRGVFVIGCGIILTGITDFFTDSASGWVFFVASFIIGFIFFTKAQKKYNGSYFS